MAALLLLNRVSRTTSSISLHRVAGALGFNSLNAQIHGGRISGTLFRVRSLATLAEGASRFDEMVSVNQRKFYLLGGKGGVGKTSCAASLAVKFASHGHPTIVVSTDPAHSLSDSFSQDLSGGVLKPVQGVDSPLLALEITPEIMKDEIKRQTGDKSVKNMMDSMGLGMFAGELGDLNLEDMLNAASPGIDEIAAISKVLQFMEAPEYSRFTRIVFDTAPTGHTLRLLSLPDFYDSSISKITKLKKKITAAASAFKSVFGKKEIQQKELPNELDQLKERMEKVRNVFRDANTTEFVIVTIPTVMAINESSRLHASLRKENVPVHRLIVNQLLPQSESDCKFCSMRRKEQTRVLGLIQNDTELSGLKLIQSPLLDAEIRGVPALKFMGDLIWK
ncbi:anion-transporting ATPase family protein [Arabidopsis lyrata subsp. lyrata]|uniref:Anion-transporting ATPase family protein n=1 Tax=Arabidopsis lyrata subsp. lyrata TaxID=81972 RepID=D7MUD3_ARALL|nr:ATPase ASNA1 homolog 2 [Arabidopsis lyrata subsp. lyrata]EFH40958.1 anion-transporting ATPase family protein [Arabidopsis lyrata subsp. lyrata]|eukprot:XP_020890457.1 ATPase ASNA1 homolog 2 [Arabidopsis lyrata subsp. lyrata]